jgi:hypothetical protein
MCRECEKFIKIKIVGEILIFGKFNFKILIMFKFKSKNKTFFTEKID